MKEICSEDDDLVIMEKQIAARSTSSDEEQSRDVLAHQSPMHPENPVHPSFPHVTRLHRFHPPPPHHSSETPEPPPPPWLRCGGRHDYELTCHTVRDAGSPLTELGNNEDGDGHTGAVPQGPLTHTHRKGKISWWVPAPSNEEPAKKKGKQSWK